MDENQKANKQLNKDMSDKQDVKRRMSRGFDHEMANEPLTTGERMNNKKTKKRQ